MEYWNLINHTVIGLAYVSLATFDVWDIHTKTVWAFRAFVGLCGLTHLEHVTEALVGQALTASALLGSACAVVSVMALVMLLRNKHEVFAVGREPDRGDFDGGDIDR